MGDMFGLGTAFSGATNLAAQIYAADKNLQAVRDTNRANRQMASETNDTQMYMAEEANNLQRESLVKQQDFSHNEAALAYQRQLDFQNMMNQYNSPVEQLKRYNEAGLNPSLMFAGQGTAMSSAVSSQSSASPTSSGLNPVLPSLVTPHDEAPQLNFSSGLADGFAKLAQGVSFLSNAGKSRAETTRILESYHEEIAGMKLDNEAKKVANGIASAFGGRLADAELKNKLNQAALAISQANMYAAQGEEALSHKAFLEASTLVQHEAASLTRSNRELVDKELETYDVYRKAQIDNIRALTDQAYANAGLAREQVDEIRQLLPTRVEWAKMENGEKATQLLLALQKYSVENLTPEELNRAHANIVRQLEIAEKDQSNTWWNPVQALAWLLSPLSRTANVNVGATGSLSKSSSSVSAVTTALKTLAK